MDRLKFGYVLTKTNFPGVNFSIRANLRNFICNE
jgi:hypothetical protein